MFLKQSSPASINSVDAVHEIGVVDAVLGSSLDGEEREDPFFVPSSPSETTLLSETTSMMHGLVCAVHGLGLDGEELPAPLPPLTLHKPSLPYATTELNMYLMSH